MFGNPQGPPQWINPSSSGRYYLLMRNPRCKCYRIRFKVYCPRSERAPRWSLWQRPCTCRQCPGLRFWNIRTCRCEWLANCPRPLRWDLRTCSCKCPRIRRCPPRQYWNPRRCRCQCKPFCCRRGQRKNTRTCRCQ